MKRNLFVIFELLLMIIIAIGIIMIIYNGYHIFSGLGKSIVNVNDNNKEFIENMLKTSEYYDETNDINQLKKIQFFMDFNDYEFTLYYQNGEEIELYDDELYNLKSYIEEKGYSKAGYYIAIDVIIIILCICINGIRKKIANDIDLFDKQMIEDVKEKSL